MKLGNFLSYYNTVINYICFAALWGAKWVDNQEAIKCAVDLMEIETLYFSGKQKALARRKYFRLLKMCGKKCNFGDSIFLKRE